MYMSSVLQRILIYMISTNNICYNFYSLYGNAKNIYKYIFPYRHNVIRKKHWLESIMDFFQICLMILFQYILLHSIR